MGPGRLRRFLEGFGVFLLNEDEPASAILSVVANQGVGCGVVGGKGRVAASGAMLEEDVGHGSGEAWQHQPHDAGGKLQIAFERAEEIEDQRHG